MSVPFVALMSGRAARECHALRQWRHRAVWRANKRRALDAIDAIAKAKLIGCLIHLAACGDAVPAAGIKANVEAVKRDDLRLVICDANQIGDLRDGGAIGAKFVHGRHSEVSFR